MAAPDVKLVVKRPFENLDGSKFLAPIGDVSLWKDAKGKWSGQFRDYRNGQTYKVYPQDNRTAASQKPPRRPSAEEPGIQDEEPPF